MEGGETLRLSLPSTPLFRPASPHLGSTPILYLVMPGGLSKTAHTLEELEFLSLLQTEGNGGCAPARNLRLAEAPGALVVENDV
jgi:hypothetical protein